MEYIKEQPKSERALDSDGSEPELGQSKGLLLTGHISLTLSYCSTSRWLVWRDYRIKIS